MTVAKEKTALRRSATARRAEAAEAAPGAADALAGHVDALPTADVVSAYVAMRSEIDPLPLVRALAKRGTRIALPAIVDGDMEFRLWVDGDSLVPGTFGTSEPQGAVVRPGLLLVPLLAFTRDGLRLGYGGGFYDRWLAAHPEVPAFGIAYAAQERQELPSEPHDQRLTGILTEKAMILTGARPCA